MKKSFFMFLVLNLMSLSLFASDPHPLTGVLISDLKNEFDFKNLSVCTLNDLNDISKKVATQKHGKSKGFYDDAEVKIISVENDGKKRSGYLFKVLVNGYMTMVSVKASDDEKICEQD